MKVVHYYRPVIYKLVNLANDKCYVGSTAHFVKRQRDHIWCLKHNRHFARHLQRAWDKYGEDSFEFIILETVLKPEYLFDREQYWLTLLKPVYNPSLIVNQRSPGWYHSEETRQKMSQDRKGRAFSLGRVLSEATKKKIGDSNKGKIKSEETRKKLQLAMAGEKNPFYGKKHSPETVEFLRQKGIKEGGHFKKGHKHLESSKEKIRQARLGKPGPVISEEGRKRLSEQKMGAKNPNYGKKLSEETRRKMSEAHKKRKENNNALA
jgi:group I intron endonuclease